MHWYFWKHLSVLQKFFICCVVRLQCHIHLSRGSTLCSNRQSNASPTLSSPTFGGFRPVSQSQMVVLGETCLFARTSRLFRLLRQAHCLYRTISWLSVPILTATFYSPVWRIGQPNLVMFQTYYRRNSQSRIALACSNPELKWPPL